MKKYNSYEVGPVLRKIRKDRELTIDDVAEKTGISTSTISQLEQGGRNLSMKNLYMLMEVYETDANTLLDIRKDAGLLSIDSELEKLPKQQREFLRNSFAFMLNQVGVSV